MSAPSYAWRCTGWLVNGNRRRFIAEEPMPHPLAPGSTFTGWIQDEFDIVPRYVHAGAAQIPTQQE